MEQCNCEESQYDIDSLIQQELLDTWILAKRKIADSAERICDIVQNSAEALIDTMDSIARYDNPEDYSSQLNNSMDRINSACQTINRLKTILKEKQNAIIVENSKDRSVIMRSNSSNIYANRVTASMKIGDRVSHIAYGPGVISEISKVGNNTVVEVFFVDVGNKQCIINQMHNYLCNTDQIYDSILNKELEILEKNITAAARGKTDALYELGTYYEHGRGIVKRNNSNAVWWYKKGAEHGNPHAQLRLAECYYHGIGVEKNEEEAKMWCKKAASQGSRGAERLLINLRYRELRDGNAEDLPF